ncbi:Sec-independent protein translocase subunit TatA/TatB [Ktedonospora formicarum]|uniref:Sec-independent protein translocase protein TatA n=1 Tax=Ktedonospora formicarum TaxID=2778364 RepID=A0A8J3HZM4_9CHLR|nr:twin-arginine translocase TatA/TatE family subunit [Ktedonospora formicarum]GHO43428.1 hypothetical protein KSX_15910 [Ktedonospora formicarum]
MPFGIHPLTLVVVVVVALLVFGPKRLPEMGSAIGKSIQQFKQGMSELNAPKEKPVEAEEVKPAEAKKVEEMDIDALEREIAARKAALNAQETASSAVDADKKN